MDGRKHVSGASPFSPTLTTAAQLCVCRWALCTGTHHGVSFKAFANKAYLPLASRSHGNIVVQVLGKRMGGHCSGKQQAQLGSLQKHSDQPTCYQRPCRGHSVQAATCMMWTGLTSLQGAAAPCMDKCTTALAAGRAKVAWLSSRSMLLHFEAEWAKLAHATGAK